MPDKKKFSVEINRNWCKGCEVCVAVCPKKVFAAGKKVSARGYFCPDIDGEKCAGCMQCVLLCPDVAIKVTGK
ncbi:MAG: ferredoxin family protein [Planctomycetes bacterium]|nr:ferredoxin family protein [Planctomycetota bacterium]